MSVYNFRYLSTDNLDKICSRWFNECGPLQITVTDIINVVIEFAYFVSIKFSKYHKDPDHDHYQYTYDLKKLIFENDSKTIKLGGWYSYPICLFSNNGYLPYGHYELNIKSYSSGLSIGICTNIDLLNTSHEIILSKTFDLNLDNFYAFYSIHQMVILKDDNQRNVIQADKDLKLFERDEHIIKMIVELNNNSKSFIRWEIDGEDVFPQHKFNIVVNNNTIFYPFLQLWSGKFDSGLHIEILQ